MADAAIDTAVAQAEAGLAPSQVGERAKRCVDAAIENGERVAEEPAAPSEPGER